MKKTIAVLLLLLAGSAAAQDGAKARSGLESFLKDALGPGDALDRIERDPRMDFMHPGAVAFTRWGELTAAVDSRTGDVKFFSRFKPLLYVLSHDGTGKERTADDRAAEIARRARFTLDEDEKRARVLLSRHYPDFEKRVFAVQKDRRDHDALVEDELVFTERPRAGVVACWPNRIDISVNPETGAIVTWIADDRRVESTEKPKIGEAAARKAVLDRFGKAFKPENSAWIEKEAPVVLAAVQGEKGPRTVWLVARRFVVDAATGACRLSEEK